MKAILIAAITLTSFSSFAETNAQLTPRRPVYCDSRNQNDYRFINWIEDSNNDGLYDIEKVFEDENTVAFRFKTGHGSCEDGVIQPKAVVRGEANVELKKEKGLIDKKVTVLDVDTALIELTFDKRLVFKNFDKIKAGEVRTREYKMEFIPGEKYKAGGYYRYSAVPNTPPQLVIRYAYLKFPWTLTLIEDGINGTRLQILQH